MPPTVVNVCWCLLTSGAAGLVVPTRAAVGQASGPNFGPVLRSSASVPRHGAVVAQEGQAKLPFFLDIETKGGIIFWSVVGIGAPFFVYNFLQEQLGMDVVGAGNVILVGYVGIGVLAWTSTYVFRVANKDMTYAKQLRDYENAVIQKRFEELNTDQVDALMDEIYPEKPKEPPKK